MCIRILYHCPIFLFILMPRGEDVWAHKTSLTSPLYTDVRVPSKYSTRSYICVLGVSILPLSTIFPNEFGNCSDIVVNLLFFIVLSQHITTSRARIEPIPSVQNATALPDVNCTK